MTSPWKVTTSPGVETMNFAEIMSEEYAHRVQDQEVKRYEQKLKERQQLEDKNNSGSSSISYSEAAALSVMEDEKATQEVLQLLQAEAEADSEFNSDAAIAAMLQSQFDHEYNEELRRIEQQRNKHSKVTVTLDKFRRNGDLEFLHGADDEDHEEEEHHEGDWDRFETNEKKLDAIPKCGFRIDEEGEMVTKHDADLCGVRNACRIMSFPPEFLTGDGAGFDMKLSNRVYNQLKTYSRRGNSNSGSNKKNNMHDRAVGVSTAEMGVDAPTRLLLYKIRNQILEQINGIISTGKEAIVLHANSNPNFAGEEPGASNVLLPAHLMPKEVAIKIFRTTLNEFKQRDRYIKDDYRFKERFKKQNKRVVIHMWAEKEMHNMVRMQAAGINCPDVIMLKKHILVMAFIGDNHNAAPKLKDARLSAAELNDAYNEVVAAMHKLYHEAKLVHADLNEYNILWHDGKCWFIDVAQSVEPEHPGALEFLMRDCANIIQFFKKRSVSNILTKEQLFEHITGLNAETHNAALLERIHTQGASVEEATAPNQELCPAALRPLEYPFDLAWEKSQKERAGRLHQEAACHSQLLDADQEFKQQ